MKWGCKIVNVAVVFFILLNPVLAQDSAQLYSNKALLTRYVSSQVLPALNPVLLEAETSARNRKLLFTAGSITVGGLIVWQYQQSLESLRLKLDQLAIERQNFFNAEYQNYVEDIRAASVQRAQALQRQNQALGQGGQNVRLGPTFGEQVNVQPHRNLGPLNSQLLDLPDEGMAQWWDLMRQRGATQMRLNLAGEGIEPSVLSELLKINTQIEDLEQTLFSNGQREAAFEVKKIKAHGDKLIKELQDADEALRIAQTRLQAAQDRTNVAYERRTKIKALKLKYIRIGTAAVLTLGAAGYFANIYWINQRYADYFGQSLSQQKISSDSTMQLKIAALYQMAKIKVFENYANCAEETDFSWTQQSIRDLESNEYVVAWINAMHDVCMQLTTFNASHCQVPYAKSFD